nr:hypothetical protein [Clostridium magnum]
MIYPSLIASLNTLLVAGITIVFVINIVFNPYSSALPVTITPPTATASSSRAFIFNIISSISST